MTPEQITKWADAAELYFALPSKSEVRLTTPEKLQAFAALVRNATLEEAAIAFERGDTPVVSTLAAASILRSLKT